MAFLSTPGTLRLLAGWITLLAGAALPWIHYGPVAPDDALSALALTAVFTVFFLLLVPVFGGLGEMRTTVSALIFSATFFLIVTYLLSIEGDWLVARLYQFVQGGFVKLLGLVVGDDLAKVVLSPLYLIVGIVLLVSFAMRNPTGFFVVLGLLLLNGLYPFKPFVLTGVLLWCAGLCLVKRPHFHLPTSILEVLSLDEEDERFLLELRERPLTQGQALLLLGHSPDPSILAIPNQGRCEHIPDEALARMCRLSDAGLIEYDAASGKIQASQLLEESRVSPAGAKFVDTCSWMATLVLIGLAGAYFLIPVDLLPEALVGPIGYLDDAILAGISLLPLSKRVTDRLAKWRRQPS